jgi:hypothetical protein
VFNPGKQLAVRHTVASQFVGYDHTWHILKAFQQPAKESLGRVAVSPWLNEDIEHDTVLIDRAPKIMLHSANPDEHLVEVPLISRSWTTATQAFGKVLAEFLAPAPDGLIGDNNAPLGQEELNVSQAEAEHVVQPDRMTDDLGAKAKAVVRVGRRYHAASLAGLKSGCQAWLT